MLKGKIEMELHSEFGFMGKFCFSIDFVKEN